MITLNIVSDVLVPFVLGVFAPLATAWISQVHLPEWLETFANAGLAALFAVIPTVAFDGSWKDYALAVVLAWLGTMRSHYTKLPSKLWTPPSAQGRHSKQGD